MQKKDKNTIVENPYGFDFREIIAAIPEVKRKKEQLARDSRLKNLRPLIEESKLKKEINEMPFISRLLTETIVDGGYSYGQWVDYCITTPLLSQYDENERASFAYNVISGIKNGQSMQENKIEILFDFLNVDLTFKDREGGRLNGNIPNFKPKNREDY